MHNTYIIHRIKIIKLFNFTILFDSLKFYDNAIFHLNGLLQCRLLFIDSLL